MAHTRQTALGGGGQFAQAGGGLSGVFFRGQAERLNRRAAEPRQQTDNAAQSAQSIFAAAAGEGRAARRRVGQRFGRAETFLSALLGGGGVNATRKTLLGA